MGSGEPEILIEAIEAGNAEQVRRFLREGANPNELVDEGLSPLMAAVKSTDDAVIIQILIDAGADPNIRGINGITALAGAGGYTNNFEGFGPF